MKNNIINVTENSNIELNEKSIELLLQGVCNSFECADFRNNQCRMKLFIDMLQSGEWEWSQTWATPTKFLLHIVKHGENSTEDTAKYMSELKNQWSCIETDSTCNCDFLDEIKRLKKSYRRIYRS